MCLNARDIVRITNETFHEKDDFHRYASWDYCYGLAQCMHDRRNELTDYDYDLMALSLSNYLFSWGMGRIKFLRERSYKIHIEPLKTIFKEENLWNGFLPSSELTSFARNLVDLYKTELEVSASASEESNRMTDTLFSKTLLGLTGNVVAYDQYCKNAVSYLGRGRNFFRNARPTSWDKLLQSGDFDTIADALENANLPNANYPVVKYIERRYVQTDERRYYPPAKLVDMFLFNLGTKIKRGDSDIPQRPEAQIG